MSQFVLVHSPLCGPGTWLSTAEALRTLGHATIVPTSSSHEANPLPLWQQQANMIAYQVQNLRLPEPLIWVGHSGAGLRLPAYRDAVVDPVQGYIFVDAGLPYDFPAAGLSQLDAMRRENLDFAEDLQDFLAKGGRFPNWTDELLHKEIPNPDLRAIVLRELQPQALRYFAESIPVSALWPDVPCAYLHFSTSYDADAAYAIRQGWPYHKIEAGHFQMLNDPKEVAQVLTDLAQAITMSD